MQQPSPTDQSLPEVDDFLNLDDARVAAVNEFDSLDALLNDSLKSIAQDKAVKEARKRLAKGGFSNADREADTARVRQWELDRIWTPMASVAYFETQECSCCRNRQHHFKGYFQRQTHRTSKIDRWVQADLSTVVTSEKLPKEIKDDHVIVPTCIRCAVLAGWGVE